MALQETMKALSDPVRRQILVLLREGELPAGEIAQQLGMSPPATSWMTPSPPTPLCRSDRKMDRNSGEDTEFSLSNRLI